MSQKLTRNAHLFQFCKTKNPNNRIENTKFFNRKSRNEKRNKAKKH